VASVRDDLLDLFDRVWERHLDRMSGLTDEELAWRPTADVRIGLEWRLEHVADLLTDRRAWRWLGADPGHMPPQLEAADPAAALARGAQAYAGWRVLLGDLRDDDLAASVGPVAGTYAAMTRRSVVLHVAEELVHHTAEAALLRDLWAARSV
jgi:hypothetical protein